MTEFCPRTAFGLKASALAFQAKNGRKLGRADRVGLIEACAAWVPEDPQAAQAVTLFVEGVLADPAAAGEALLQFLDRWHVAGIATHARACEAVLRATDDARQAAIMDPAAPSLPGDRQGPHKVYAWMERADTGG